MDEQGSLVVVGGGPAGSCLAGLLARQGWRVHVLEAQRRAATLPPGRDLRTLALADPAWATLSELGITPAQVGAMPIRRIHVSYRGRPGRVLLDARESGRSSFGHTVSYGRLLHAARSSADSHAAIRTDEGCRVDRVAGAASAARVTWHTAEGLQASRLTPLAVIADGGGLDQEHATLSWRYRTHALACQVQTDTPTGDLAWERFTPEGPLALLPSSEGYALIWTGPGARIERLRAASDAAFLAELQDWFGDRAGRFVAVSARLPYPLAARFALTPARHRVVRIANAAQTLHPVAGQGFNLGLRDVRALTEALGSPPESDPGSAATLDAYLRARGEDRWLTSGLTHLLAGAFALPLPGTSLPGSLALALLDLNAPLRQRFARLMAEGVGA